MAILRGLALALALTATGMTAAMAENVKCDVMIAVHPGFADLLEKQAARTSGSNPFIVPGECRTYAANAHQRLAKCLKSEASQ
ncbi:hypothetical protein [Massilia scottii]|uniref:hypothetical protein n=1 Tax=Massilia scottii TaxID=3057166 RepID=UPI002796C06F|nr:hypothetical protein [Massilia sp. CCM 9029]MDQ1832040.1 hypothetical protein [Massilia sp. CCM 9029]